MEAYNIFIEHLKEDPYFFLLEFFVILLAVKIAGHLSKKLGQPAVFGELLVGIILGPALLGWIEIQIGEHSTLSSLAEVGVILLMFLAGLETDVDEFRKTALGSSLTAVGGVVLPLVGGYAAGIMFGFDPMTSIFIGTLLVATSVSISVQTLRELGELQSKEGVTILGAAVLDDVLGLITLSVVLGFASSSGSGFSVLALIWLLVRILLFFVITIVFGRYVLPRIFDYVSGLMTQEVILTFGIMTALGFAFFAEQMGLAGIIGAYFAGLMLSMTKYQHELFHKIETISFSFFVPIFFVSIGVMANLAGLNQDILILIAVLTVIAIITKWLGGIIGAKLAGFSWRSSSGIGAGMIARGEVGLIVASIGLNKHLIDEGLFTAMVIIVLVTTLVTPPALKMSFSKRS
ncbi:cation:proton antiporter [Mechercharimyces sp. CAU 1602]|uniref:cation:proton antiporter n=1 Tax=Mechercharimyces sp. CAU 1602 TaxID=2973933 RepID=UPI002161FD82|nr:cation:proton antiporter [Mechercharimyces sp. CAU 1602]MCS1350511.1 cation:proton antiporter [Mechercharimyces sp. CAU 1602]